MNHHTIKSIAIACGLALTLSALAATSFARGPGHSSHRMSRAGRSFVNRRNFASNRFHNYRFRYGGGYYGSPVYSYGWGWPYYSCNSYVSNGVVYSNGVNAPVTPVPATDAGGPPVMPTPAPENTVVAPTPDGPPGPAGNPTPAVASTNSATAAKPTPVIDEQTDVDDEKTIVPPAVAVPSTANGQPTAGAKSPVPPAPTDQLVGTFKAKPEKDVQIELTLRADKKFTWKFTAGGRSETFSGVYEIGPNSLALIRDGGDKMDGTLERVGTTGFKFRMKEAEEADPGLTFTR